MFMPSGVAATGKRLSAVVSPPSSAHSGDFPIFSTVFTCVAEGGVPPLSYQWQRVSTTVPGSFAVIESPTSLNTRFIMNTFPLPDDVCTDVYRCTVTDQLGNTAEAECTVTYTRTPTT